jgi:hypothetical protein
MRMKRLSVVDFTLGSYDVEVSMDVLFTNNINKSNNVDYCILLVSLLSARLLWFALGSGLHNCLFRLGIELVDVAVKIDMQK